MSDGNGYIPVRMRDCSCPGQPHAAGDFAYLKPQADLSIGLAAHTAIFNSGTDVEELQVALGKAYTVNGIHHWDLLNAEGKPLPVSKAAVEALSWAAIAPVADKASMLYSDEVLAPLQARASKLSPNGRTKGSTSPKRRTTSKPRKP